MLLSRITNALRRWRDSVERSATEQLFSSSAAEALTAAISPPNVCVLIITAATVLGQTFLAASHAATPSVTAGTNSCALGTSGNVLCWGTNQYDALGIGTDTTGIGSVNPLPATVTGLTTGVASMTTGQLHSCALNISGGATCWGTNRYGQLGDGTTTDRPTPVSVPGLGSGIRTIFASIFYTCAVTNSGTVFCWGGGGQLGGPVNFTTTPKLVAGLNGVVALTGGAVHACVLTTTGAVQCWGANPNGELGTGTTTSSSTPVTVSGLTSGVTSISSGFRHTCAVTAAKGVVCWGANPNGELGTGNTASSSTPAQVSSLTSGVVAVSAGSSHTCALMASGGVLCWGLNDTGQLGNGTRINSNTPVTVTGLPGTVTSISVGGGFTCASTTQGTAVCWGVNGVGQLGIGATNGSDLFLKMTPTPVVGLPAGITAVSAGSAHACARSSAGELLCWGGNSSGALGTGALINSALPVLVRNLPSEVTSVATSNGGPHSCALTSLGTVYCWGANYFGQIGIGQASGPGGIVPTQTPGLSGVTAIAVGGSHSCAVSGGTVFCWGSAAEGQLGEGTVGNGQFKVFATQVGGLSSIAKISAGLGHSCALGTQGSVSCWGENSSGQLGNGTTTRSALPVQVTGLTSGVKSVSLGWYQSCALTTAGNVNCWGSGSTVPRSVTGLSNIVAISVGDRHSCALNSSGGVLCWGLNDYGQLGNGTTNFGGFPVAVSGLSSGIAAIAAGVGHTCAVTTQDTVLCWGRSVNGELGDGTFTYRTTPTVVLRPLPAGSIAKNDWFLDLNPAATKTIPADKIPAFLAIASNTGNDFLTNLQYRAADVGTSGSVYVFALAPASMVKSVSAEALLNHKGPVTRGINTADAPLPCVLAQLTASGQLTAVTAGSLQAYLTGVLTSQGASVSVLNGVSTALLSGSVFYVGYGSNSTSMINGGTNRSVVTVPGTQTCQPQAPQTGWWWNAAQDGRGFGIEVRGNTMFVSGYLYDDTGHATWVVAAGATALDGSFFNNTLYHVSNGQTLTGTYKAPAPVAFDGPVTLTFTDARNGNLIWSGGSIPLVRFDDVIGSGNGVTPSFVPENGWWWNESESGRGFFMEFKNNFAFIAGYMYEADGRPIWYTAQSTMASPQTFSSNWLQVANGQTMTGPYKKPVIINSNVGPVTFQFTDASNAILTLPGGRQVAITRHRF